jgi:hypothetical protein
LLFRVVPGRTAALTADASDVRPWDAKLLDDQCETSLVTIGRERRLVLDEGRGLRYVDLCWVDEVALALIELAVARRRSIDLVYPAPAGQVAVLLAAELLLSEFVRGVPSPSIGIVTADTTMTARTWNAVCIANPGARASISGVFPCFRAGPEGESPVGGRRFKGIIVGQRCAGWPVDLLVVDHLAGPVHVDGDQPSIEVFSDPLDRTLREAEGEGRLVWGWSDSDVARCNAELEVQRDHTVPFSVAADRLDAIAEGVAVTVTVAMHPEAEAAFARAREDLRLLRAMSPRGSDRHVERGLSVAWHHLSTLTSLPCAPQRFDRFSGIPPWAARSTRTFVPELSAWASTLSGDIGEVATILASDIGDLRAALDRGNPFETALKETAVGDVETLVVTRTRTASRALLDALGADPSDSGTGCITVCPVGRLHRHGAWPRALVIGEPPPWNWHRLLSGLSTDLEVLTLGRESARSCTTMVSAVREAREQWGSADVRGRTWRALLDSQPPPPPAASAVSHLPVVLVEGAEYVPEPDPFDEFSSLFDLDPFDLGGEGPRSGLAHESQDGEWNAEVDAVEVSTDCGRILLETGRPVEIRVGPKIVDRRPEQLQAGDALLIGRRQGRVGLLEALEERLGHRPDLLAARLLIDNYRRLVRSTFATSGLTVAALHREMGALGCDRTTAAVRDWVTGETMAPQQFDDLERLRTALDLPMSEGQLRELFAGVQRRRGFRRAAGRALAAAARSSTLVEDENRIDADTGLSIADLRDAVIEAVVITVARRDGPVPLTLIGQLEENA